nr:MAG TPA: hypothetical protein [Caudoviricetes sp.]DAL19722.1 MAG TPA_asm: hypothetical protein [Caudoviricetes sp.]
MISDLYFGSLEALLVKEHSVKAVGLTGRVLSGRSR